jgi:hypothetical protein
MAEMDVFERRVADTLLGYADEAAPTLDAATVARRVALAYPRRAAAGLLPWRLVAIPRVAWVLLLAGLLLAIIGGTLLVGSQLERRLPPRVAVSIGPVPTCPPGSNPDEPGPVSQARPQWLGASAFDRRAGKLVYLAFDTEGDQETWTVETWTFDVCTNTWTRMHPDREPPALVSDLVYDVDSDVTIGVQYKDWLYPEVIGNVWAYDLEANTWTEHGAAPMREPRLYDPVSGLVLADEWTYDVETDSWTPNPRGGDCHACVYDASVDRAIKYRAEGVPATSLLDLRTGAWSKSGADTPDCSMHAWAYPAIVYDEAAERTVVAGADRWGAYDAAADQWEILFEVDSENRPDRPAVYDPVNRRLLMWGSGYWDMVAFDLATREWTVLLEPDLSESDPCVSARPGWALDRAPASTDPDGSPWIRAASVTLHGGPFFTRVVGVADEPLSSTPPAAPATVIDGLFLPECQGWTDGTVWWEETTRDPASRAWIEIDLGGTFELDGAVVQADVDDIYLLSYRDPETAAWLPLWDIRPGEAGEATRPHQGDASARWPLTRPVVTDALRFEANSSCESAASGNLSPPEPTSAPCGAQYSVSEIAVFGVPAP